MNKQGNEQSDSFGVLDHDEPIPADIPTEKHNEIPGRHIQPESLDIVDIRSAVHSNYVGMVAMIRADDTVCLGKRENYDDMGYYDNIDNSLVEVSENTDMYYWLYGEGWPRSQADMLNHGLTMEQYIEFARLQDGILRQFDQRHAILFDGQPFQPPENYLRTAELTMEGGKNNYNMIDGIVNNQAAPRADLTDGQTHDEVQELAPETLHRPSVIDQLDQYTAGQGSPPAYSPEHDRSL